MIREAICDVYEISDERELHAGIDGCSAPAYALTLEKLAFGFARLCAVSTVDDNFNDDNDNNDNNDGCVDQTMPSPLCAYVQKLIKTNILGMNSNKSM